MPVDYPIIVFSHLRWDFVYQRPQHLFGRLATHRRVIFIEEPIHDSDVAPFWEKTSPASNVTVCRPHTPVQVGGFSDEQLPLLTAMLHQLCREEGLEQYLVWMYTPMALPLAQTLTPLVVIYDVMDELAAFKFAPPQLLKREAALYQWADVVFVGGPSLYRARQGRHPNLHCFSSSVDVAHFRQVREGLPEAQDQSWLPRPRFGFYGVIDERVDLELIDAIATLRPDWQFINIGPVVKIDPAALPRHPNVHYAGPRLYSELPSYLAGWDVAIMPFARNESTRYISPTKTLEYMAAEVPIVSTPIADVVEPYGSIVYSGATAETFVAACERALHATDAERTRRTMRMREVMRNTSWDTTVRSMERLIRQALVVRQTAVPQDKTPVATNDGRIPLRQSTSSITV